MNNNKKKLIAVGALLLVLIIGLFKSAGINDAGHRTVIQYLNGTMKVKFDSGMYLTYFGKVTTYPDVITFDFDKSPAVEEATLDQTGIVVRYRDGGTGLVYGATRFRLPSDEMTMIELHKSFRSTEGVAYKLLKTRGEAITFLTSGLFTSEEAYSVSRGTFTSWVKEQLNKGQFVTQSESITTTDEVTGEIVVREVSKRAVGEDGQPMYEPNDLEKYGIIVDSFSLTDWDFEDSTLKQISAKREATMAIMTSKALAEQAKQEAKQAEEDGKREVVIAQYTKEVEKSMAVVEAEQKKEVALLDASRVKEEATILKETAEIDLERIKVEAMGVIETATAEADARTLILAADGALEQKLQAEIAIQEKWANAFATRAVPSTVTTFGGSESTVGGDSDVSNFMKMMTIQAAKDLNYDRSVDTIKPKTSKRPAPLN